MRSQSESLIAQLGFGMLLVVIAAIIKGLSLLF